MNLHGGRMEMVAEIKNLNPYQQFMQQDRNTQSNPVKPVSTEDSAEKQPIKPLANKVYTDINDVKDTFEKFSNNAEQVKVKVNDLDSKVVKNKDMVKATLAALSPIISFRRVSSVPDKLDDKDYLGTAGAIAVAGVMLPEDLRDMKDAWNQIVHKELPKYDYKNCQAPFRFIRGTLAEKPVNRMGKYGYYAHKFDKSFAETKIGEKIRKLLKVNFGKPEATGRKVPKVIKDESGYSEIMEKVYAEKLEGSFAGKLIYRAMQRTTVIGAVILAAIGVPSIIKAFKKPEETQDKFANAGKQSLKVSINVASVLSGIGTIGALGAKKGPTGSVIGMGIGSVLGAYIAGKINKNIKTQS